MMHFQPIVQGDLAAINALRPLDWVDIATPYAYYVASPICRPIKLVLEGKIAGVGAAIFHADTAWLGHIIVDPAYRGRGLGHSITTHLVGLVKQHNIETIYLIATDLGAPVYSKIGFVTETEYLFYKDLSRLDNAVRSDFVEPCGEHHWEAVKKLDQDATGEDRSLHLLPHLAKGFVFCEMGRIEGFYLPTWGDGLTVAMTENAGKTLMAMRLATQYVACFPKENLTAMEFLGSLGASPFRSAKRMRLGKERAWKPACIYNRVGGNFG